MSNINRIIYTRQGGLIKVSSPYSMEFVTRAKELGARWDSTARTWNFDQAKESSLRAICLDIFGVEEGDLDETLALTAEREKLIERLEKIDRRLASIEKTKKNNRPADAGGAGEKQRTSGAVLQMPAQAGHGPTQSEQRAISPEDMPEIPDDWDQAPW